MFTCLSEATTSGWILNPRLALAFLDCFHVAPLLVETCEITLYFPFVSCLDALSFYLYTPIALPGCVFLTILPGAWWAVWYGDSGSFLNCLFKQPFFWIVSVFLFSISDYAQPALALTTFHNCFPSKPPKLLFPLYFSTLLFLKFLAVFPMVFICSVIFGCFTDDFLRIFQVLSAHILISSVT